MAGSEMHAMEDGKPNAIDGVKFTKDSDCVNMAQPSTKLIGLTKEELEKYRNDPFWKTIRYTLFVLFWLVWAAMFVGAILIVVLSPKCAAKVEPKWHENAVTYQIFTPTFHDSNADGVGDFKGIEDKLDSLRKVGVTAIWPTPIVKTNKDVWAPEEVVDASVVDPRFGDEKELQSLIDATHRSGLKFIADLPLTAFSEAASTAKNNNNGTRATLLDLANEQVQNKLLSVARKWLQMGVDGLFLANYGLAKASPGSAKSPTELIRRLRKAISEDEATAKKELILFAEGQKANEAVEGESYYPQSLVEPVSSAIALLDNVEKNIQHGLNTLSKNGTTVRPIWQLASLFQGHRLDQLLQDGLKTRSVETSSLLTLIELFLPGPVNVLYGEELALPSVNSEGGKKEHFIQPWDTTTNSGFSTISGKLFFAAPNVSRGQTFSEQFGNSSSPLKAFERLAELRVRDPVFQQGECRLQHQPNGVHLYTRVIPGSTSDAVYALVVNWYETPKQWSIPSGQESATLFGGRVPSGKAEVKVPSAFNSAQAFNQELDLASKPLTLEPFTAAVLKLS